MGVGAVTPADRHRPGYMREYYRQHRAARLDYARRYREECRDVIRAKARERRRCKNTPPQPAATGGIIRHAEA